jgi:hypothetical protein
MYKLMEIYMTEEVSSDTGNVTSTEANKNPNLNIADLVNVLQVIRTCAGRGSFRADEMTTVGGLYDRLQAFLVSTGAVKITEDGDDDATPAATV